MALMALGIVHREPGQDLIPSGAPTWRTCLREVVFSDDATGSDRGQTGVRPHGRLAEGEAYRLVLEILCGLQSPMLGETQVMGQFKVFLASLDRDHAWLNKLGQRLLTDAREVRTQYLQGLGSRSYGSAVRRHLTGCRRAVLIGTGKLAQEVLPFLTDDGRSVDHWGRREEAGTSAAGVTYRTLDQIDGGSTVSEPAVLIIAAPVPSDVVHQVAGRYTSLQCVIDLRAELGSGPLDLPVPVVTLQNLFAQMNAANVFASRHVEAARADIARRSRLYEFRDELRPFGWDDLCA
jgi:glutamyl-tRNA reductase